MIKKANIVHELPINTTRDFPVISKLYKHNFIASTDHLLIGARIVPKTQIEDLAESIREDGLRHPILVREQSNKSYQVLSGHMRKYAFKRLGKETIPAKIIKADNLQAKALLITANRFQHPLAPIEEAWVIEDLIKNHDKSLNACAAILNMSKTWVYHRYSLAAKLIKQVQLDIAMGLIPPRAGIEIATVHAREQQKIAKSLKQKKLSFRETVTLVKIIKDTDIPDRVKELALNDPRTVIKKLSNNKKIFHASSKLSYFADNFRQETHRLSAVSLELIHRLRRDFAAFSKLEKQTLLKDLNIVDKRVKELSKLLKEVGFNG
jgi:ParB/RepB/Spo0J family partition protein